MADTSGANSRQSRACQLRPLPAWFSGKSNLLPLHRPSAGGASGPIRPAVFIADLPPPLHLPQVTPGLATPIADQLGAEEDNCCRPDWDMASVPRGF